MDLDLGERVAIVTGGARGIGAGIAQAYAVEGGRVVICDIDGTAAEARAAALEAKGFASIGLKADVTSHDDVARVVETAMKRFGRIDALFNNAGFPRDSFISKMTEQDWDAVVDVILKGAFLFTRAVMPTMIKARSGRIINISSRAHLGNPGQANYSAAKAGLLGFTRATALESAKFNITVNAIAPGFIRSEGIERLPNYRQVAERAIANTPVMRVGEVEDIARVAVFLASPHAGYITGEVMHVTGGRYS